MRDGTIRKGQDGRARPGLLVINDGWDSKLDQRA
jgi:hypothetical protein